MSQNDTHVIVHNHIEGFSNMQILTVVLFVVIASIIVLLLIIAIVILLFMLLKKNKVKVSDHTSQETLKESASQTAPKTLNEENFSHAFADNPAVILSDDDTDINSNSQNIPMSILKSRLDDQFCDSPESTPSVYENLYPSHHSGEIIPGPKPKLKTFAGRMFAATKSKATFSKPETETSKPPRKPSSGKEPSSSLEWDYFESRPYFEPRPSDASDRSETIAKNTVDVCWV